jgi:hypothetical protein
MCRWSEAAGGSTPDTRQTLDFVSRRACYNAWLPRETLALPDSLGSCSVSSWSLISPLEHKLVLGNKRDAAGSDERSLVAELLL